MELRIQKELKTALELLEEYPDRKLFLLPARLDDYEPEMLSDFQWADFRGSYENGLAELLRAIESQNPATSSLKTATTLLPPASKKIYYISIIASFLILVLMKTSAKVRVPTRMIDVLPFPIPSSPLRLLRNSVV